MSVLALLLHTTPAVAAAPSITGFSPESGPVGASVVVSGGGFTDTSGVTFGGVAAPFVVDSDDRISATVPEGAATGPIAVTTPEGTATSASDFVVRPNLVLILTDDQRWDSLWAMPIVRSELMDKGVTFSNAFVSNPLCCPSRATNLTGRYSHSHGIWENVAPFGGWALFDESSTIATWLDDAGYATAFVGKYLNGYSSSGTLHVPPGWDRWFVFAGGQPPRYFDYAINDQGNEVHYGSEPSDYSTDVLAQEAARFIVGSNPNDPLFLLLAPFAPHNPALPAPRHDGAFAALDPWRPPSYNEQRVRDKPEYIRNRSLVGPDVDELRIRQLETLLAVDDAVGAIVTALADSGRLSSTAIVFTSDNGFHWGEHRLRGKRVPYEESIRVPFVVRYDPLPSTPRTDDRLVANIDTAPTLTDLAGIAPGGPVDGRSFRPLLDSTASSWRAAFLVERPERTKVPAYCALRKAAKVFVHYSTGEEEFYPLRKDPYQLKNKASAPRWQSTIARMRARARALCDPLPPGMPPF